MRTAAEIREALKRKRAFLAQQRTMEKQLSPAAKAEHVSNRDFDLTPKGRKGGVR